MRKHRPTLLPAALAMAVAVVGLGTSGCGLSTPSVPASPITSVYGNEASSGLPRAPVRPPWGFIFTQYSAPLDYEFNKGGTPTPTGMTMRKGSSESHFVMLWPISSLLSVGVGDSDFDNAVKDGNLSTVHYADYEYMNILFLYTRTKVHVYGE